jgi:hypothetical protein
MKSQQNIWRGSSGLTVQLWLKKFHNGDLSLKGKECQGLLAIDNNQMRVLVETGPCQTVQEMVQELDVDPATVSCHLPQIGDMKKLNKWVQHRLNESKRNCHGEVCSVLLFKNKPFPY